MSSQVVTFYEDEAKTNALYPRTKLSAISDDDGKALSETIDELNTKTRINYLRPTLPTTTSNGVTITNNGDGTYTLNGTATAQVSYFLVNYPINNFAGKKVLGCSSGGSSNTYSIFVGYSDENSNWIKESYEIGNGIKIENYPRINIGILIRSGTVCNNLVFKPMITDDLSATYDDFVSFDDSLVTGINSGLKMDLLWTNANITLSTRFNAQTLNIDFTSYKLVYIIVKLNQEDGYKGFLLSKNIMYPCDIDINMDASYGGGWYKVRRNITVNETSIDISTVVQKGTGGDVHNGYNNYLIPYQIYGIK